jgi:hypothetical protein
LGFGFVTPPPRWGGWKKTAAPLGVVSVATRPLGVVLDTRCGGVVMQYP